MSKKAKKILIIFSSILIALIVAFTIPTVHFYITWISAFSTTNYFVEDFEKFKNDYAEICDEIIKLSVQNELPLNSENYYLINMFTNNGYPYLDCNECSNYPYKEYPTMDLSSYELLENYKRISESFPSEHGYEFAFICYRENRISFHSENGHYAVVYSVDDKKPTFWFTPSEEDDINVKKITKNWYHMWR